MYRCEITPLWLLFSFVPSPHFPTNTVIKNYFYVDTTKEVFEISAHVSLHFRNEVRAQLFRHPPPSGAQVFRLICGGLGFPKGNFGVRGAVLNSPLRIMVLSFFYTVDKRGAENMFV